VTRASDNLGRQVGYQYDARGRLILVRTFDGHERRYTYTNHDEMETIDEPGISIRNSYDSASRCIRQVTRFSGDPTEYTMSMSYKTEGDRVVQTDVRESDGSWTRERFNPDGYIVSVASGAGTSVINTLTYEREAVTNIVTDLSVTCPDRNGRMQSYSRMV